MAQMASIMLNYLLRLLLFWVRPLLYLYDSYRNKRYSQEATKLVAAIIKGREIKSLNYQLQLERFAKTESDLCYNRDAALQFRQKIEPKMNEELKATKNPARTAEIILRIAHNDTEVREAEKALSNLVVSRNEVISEYNRNFYLWV